jgi:hypothetical protein
MLAYFRAIAFCLVLALSCSAGEKRKFFGTWEPPSTLLEFWAPINDSWWNSGHGSTPNLNRYCRSFAKQSRPEAIIPAMIADLKANPSEVRWFVYSNVMLNWPQETVLHILKPFCRSTDVGVRRVANEFYADIEKPE